jgi:L-seryl-tRNA(Ser) seleniumtransferase
VLEGLRQMQAAGELPAGLDLHNVEVSPPREAGHGDLASNAAMVLAKAAGMKPRDIADKLAVRLRALPDVARVAQQAGVPVLVDAAAQLPPASNLRRFIEEGADLVCFSGGKAIGGPQSSGILAGRRALVASALMQMLDLDLPDAQFRLPPDFAVNDAPPHLPHHGIGRSCKTGKEEIVGLIVALRRFVAEGDAPRQARLRAKLDAVREAMGDAPAEITDGAVPLLLLRLADAGAARAAEARLRAHRPAIHVNQGRLREGVLVVNPLALADRDTATLGAALRAVIA